MVVRHVIRHSKRLVIAIVGIVVSLIGIVMLAYPGPGILVIFAGLAILATEFDFAQGALDKARDYYDKWQEWMNRQNLAVKILFWMFTFTVVTLTAWILNTFGVVNSILDLNQDWLKSPLPTFK